MIQNPALLKAFERSITREQPVNYRQNLLIFEALYFEARALGVLPLKDPLDGIDVDLHLARVLHARKTSREDRQSAG
jgi:hypothetical protein